MAVTWSSLHLLRLLFTCCGILIALGGNVRELSPTELQSIENSAKKTFTAVYFNRASPGKTTPKSLEEFERCSDVLQPYDIELAKVSCEGKTIPQCTENSQKISLYRKGEPGVLDELPLNQMFNEDSIVANLLHIILSEDYHYIPDEQSFTDLLSSGIGRKDVIFTFVKALGIRAHRHFLEFVHHLKGEAIFGMTTDASIAKKFKLSTDAESDVRLFHCKEETHTEFTENKCRTTRFQGKTDKVHLARFLKSQTLPKYVVLPSSKTTVYDSLSAPVNKVVLFTDRLSDLPYKELEQMYLDFQGSIGIIVVDVNEHRDMLQSFGLARDSNFPTAAFVPVTGKKKNKTYVELYPESTVPFSISNLKNFVKPLIEIPTDEYSRIAESSSLQLLTYAQYDDAMKSTDTNYLLAVEFLLVVFCNGEHEPCKTFSSIYRRIVRTYDRAGQSRITMVYVETSLHNRKFEGETFPVIRLHTTKSSTEYIQYTGIPDYELLMDFIAEHTRIQRPLSLPLSLSDLPPILVKAGEDETIFPPEDEGGETIESYNPEEGFSLPAEETEDDEVADAVLKTPPTDVPNDLVPALTDKTFDVTKEMKDLLVVDFYQPWDPRSKAFLKPYVDAAASLGGLDVGEFSIQLARVNCFDWTYVCEKNNITRYPTVKMFRRGSNEVTYNGPLDSDHLTKAVLLFQPSVPFELKSKPEVDMFLGGKLPKLAEKATNVAVFGMFSHENHKAFKAFGSAASTLHSEYLLGYVTGSTAKTVSSDYGLPLPSLVVFKRDDPYQPMAVFTNQFAPQTIIDFVHLSSIPSFGELTLFNLPSYLAQRKPLLIVFRANSEDAVITPVMTKLARDKRALSSLFLCWMPVYSQDDANAEILESYTGNRTALPALVLLDHQKGVVHQFKEEVTKPAVVAWVKTVLSGEVQALSDLKDGDWKPLLEGYDFLRMIDEEEEEEEKKRLKKHKLQQALNLDEVEDWHESAPEEEEEEQEEQEEQEEKSEHKKKSPPRRPEVKSHSRDEL